MGLVRKSCGRLDLGARHLGMAPQEDVRRTGFRRTAPHDATDLSLVEWCAYGSGPSLAGVLVLPPGWLSAGRALPERRPGTGRLDTTDRRRLSWWHWKSGPCCNVFRRISGGGGRLHPGARCLVARRGPVGPAGAA